MVEMATAAGLRLVPQDQRDPEATITRGVGELIATALDEGLLQILVGCGDSGNSDGGVGALKALGVGVLEAEGNEVPDGGSRLTKVDRLDMINLHPALKDGSAQITPALNRHKVLTGTKGVTRVFGPQKGATPEQVEQLSDGFGNWAAVLGRDRVESARGTSFAHGVGSSASGGLGAGMAAVDATFPGPAGSRVGRYHLDDLLSKANLVITAKGAIDFQTPKSKVPTEIARRATLHGVPDIGLVGTLGNGSWDV